MREHEIMTWGEVADFLRIENKNQKLREYKIRNWLKNGVLPRSTTFKIGRNVFFSRTELENFIMGCKCQ